MANFAFCIPYSKKMPNFFPARACGARGRINTYIRHVAQKIENFCSRDLKSRTVQHTKMAPPQFRGIPSPLGFQYQKCSFQKSSSYRPTHNVFFFSTPGVEKILGRKKSWGRKNFEGFFYPKRVEKNLKWVGVEKNRRVEKK